MVLKELQYILAIDKFGSISKAASSLFITQPALSRYLISLEEALGIQLFERIGNKMYLTEHGKKYIDTAKSMMKAYSDFENSINLSSQTNVGRLRIGASVLRASFMLPPILIKFQQEYPNVELSISEEPSSRLENNLLDNELDIIIINHPVIHPGISYKKLVSERIFLAVPKNIDTNHIELSHDGSSKYPTVKISQFQEHTFVLTNSYQRSKPFFQNIFYTANFTPKRTIITANLSTSAHISAAGLGITFIPETFVNQFNDHFTYFTIEESINGWDVFTAYSKGKHIYPYFLRFIELCEHYYMYLGMLSSNITQNDFNPPITHL